jgi:hypothetical protein
VPTSYELPLGVRLLRVFLEQKEQENLATSAAAARDTFSNIVPPRHEKVKYSINHIVLLIILLFINSLKALHRSTYK